MLSVSVWVCSWHCPCQCAGCSEFFTPLYCTANTYVARIATNNMYVHRKNDNLVSYVVSSHCSFLLPLLCSFGSTVEKSILHWQLPFLPLPPFTHTHRHIQWDTCALTIHTENIHTFPAANLGCPCMPLGSCPKWAPWRGLETQGSGLWCSHSGPLCSADGRSFG